MWRHGVLTFADRESRSSSCCRHSSNAASGTFERWRQPWWCNRRHRPRSCYRRYRITGSWNHVQNILNSTAMLISKGDEYGEKDYLLQNFKCDTDINNKQEWSKVGINVYWNNIILYCIGKASVYSNYRLQTSLKYCWIKPSVKKTKQFILLYLYRASFPTTGRLMMANSQKTTDNCHVLLNYAVRWPSRGEGLMGYVKRSWIKMYHHVAQPDRTSSTNHWTFQNVQRKYTLDLTMFVCQFIYFPFPRTCRQRTPGRRPCCPWSARRPHCPVSLMRCSRGRTRSLSRVSSTQADSPVCRWSVTEDIIHHYNVHWYE